MGQARKTARLAFFGQDIKLREEFLMAVHESHDLASVLGRADTLLASVQSTTNLAALKLKGWPMPTRKVSLPCAAHFPPARLCKSPARAMPRKRPW